MILAPSNSCAVRSSALWRSVALAACLAASALASGAAHAATLLQLFGGATIDAGNARFTNWTLNSSSVTSGLNPDFALITVTGLVADPANPGLQFSTAGQLAIAGINELDLDFSFRVQAINNGPSFTANSLAITGIAFRGAAGKAYISQDVATISGSELSSIVAIGDDEFNVFQFTGGAANSPRLNEKVSVNVFLTGVTAPDTISLTAWTQRFAQTGSNVLFGDFNLDKRVDGVDFLLWQRGLSPTPSSSADLAAWRNHFGEDVRATVNLAVVPEPATGVLLACAALATCRWPQLARRA